MNHTACTAQGAWALANYPSFLFCHSCRHVHKTLLSFACACPIIHVRVDDPCVFQHDLILHCIHDHFIFLPRGPRGHYVALQTTYVGPQTKNEWINVESLLYLVEFFKLCIREFLSNSSLRTGGEHHGCETCSNLQT